MGGVLLLYRERGGFIFRPLYLDRWGGDVIFLDRYFIVKAGSITDREYQG